MSVEDQLNTFSLAISGIKHPFHLSCSNLKYLWWKNDKKENYVLLLSLILKLFIFQDLELYVNMNIGKLLVLIIIV